MPFDQKVSSPSIYTPAAADAAGWALDSGLRLRDGSIEIEEYIALKILVEDVNAADAMSPRHHHRSPALIVWLAAAA